MPEELGRQRSEQLLKTMVDRLEGDWLLVGGALVALWLEPRRVTEGIDLVSFTGSPEQRYELMQLAAAAGLPIEAVNSAADFFVRRIPSWQQEIVPFRSGARARIFRPTQDGSADRFPARPRVRSSSRRLDIRCEDC